MMRICVTVDAAHLAVIDDVAGALRSCGMQVEQVLGSIGMVTGSAGESSVPALRSVDGVESVDEELTHRLPPPEAGVQ
ncbi:hypothetical protein ACH9EU_05505 [Kocuria sp. M1R5S2]|uniref:hypothetical protein n=1 Tax=Kocuria rhizosphaerae TaxID=3376285 RepID=UPI0037AE4174